MDDQPFPTVLKNLAHELERLANLAGRIDGAVGHVQISAEAYGETAEALQGVDLLRQSLECLKDYVDELACHVDDSVLANPANASKALPLRDLARHLVGQNEKTSETMRGNSDDPCFF